MARTRTLFGALCALSLMMMLPPLVITGPDAARALGLLGAAVLASVWWRRYRSDRVPLAADVAEAGAVLAVAVALPAPQVVFMVLFTQLWFRGIYPRRAGWHAVMVGLAPAVALLVWPSLPGRVGSPDAAPVLGALPTVPLFAVVARHLAHLMQQRELGQRVDAVLAELGRDLIRVRDTRSVLHLALRAGHQLRAVVPELRLVLMRDEQDPRSRGDAPGRRVGDVLDGGARPAGRRRWRGPVGSTAARPEVPSARGAGGAGGPGLERSGEPSRRWTCIPVPGSTMRVAFMASAAMQETCLAAVTALVDHVALAQRLTASMAELARLAATDALTGLANRQAFDAELRAAVQAAIAPSPAAAGHTRGALEALASGPSCPSGHGVEQLSVLFFDLDGFKAVNDRWGHPAGDHVLRVLAGRLRGCLRAQDVCARLGGDEFAVLLRGGEATARSVAARVEAAVREPIALPDRGATAGVAHLGVSAGIACLRAGDDAELLMARADALMYRDKSTRRRHVRDDGNLDRAAPAAL